MIPGIGDTDSVIRMNGLLKSNMLRLRIVGIVVPLAFAIGLGLFTEEVLHDWISVTASHLAATAVLTFGVIVFSFWIFGVLERMQAQLEAHRRRDRVQAVEMARMEERERIGLEIHDGVIQHIYGVQLKLEDCATRLESCEVATCLDDSIDELNSVIAKMRQYIFGLRPHLDGETDLPRALADLLRDAEANAAAATDLQIDEQAVREISGTDAAALFQLASEAVASAIERGATRVRASVAADSDCVRLDMDDNGHSIGSAERERWEQSSTRQASDGHVAIQLQTAEGDNRVTASVPGRPLPASPGRSVAAAQS
jgi:signal transduction histidine kinase